ncbi:hypothetical protein F3Y22_tig00003041pilonHSYRG01234 [Hibiscus syriacus]|uniref:Uncharacterized protein n=1 Tax=Hibiscus syriacus TaxID=106335 RepID=A0A6A3CRW4_HIBSY|nr:hypothetical protein F3Y22_tig00003041pilonHSYRG01234 [Hibiscus syriacus]
MQRGAGAREVILACMQACSGEQEHVKFIWLHVHAWSREAVDAGATYKVAGTTWRPTRSPGLHGDLQGRPDCMATSLLAGSFAWRPLRWLARLHGEYMACMARLHGYGSSAWSPGLHGVLRDHCRIHPIPAINLKSIESGIRRALQLLQVEFERWAEIDWCVNAACGNREIEHANCPARVQVTTNWCTLFITQGNGTTVINIAEAFASLRATAASRHRRIRYVYDLVAVVYVGYGIASGVCSQGECLLVRSYVLLKAWITTTDASSERILHREIATGSLAGLRRNQGEERSKR